MVTYDAWLISWGALDAEYRYDLSIPLLCVTTPLLLTLSTPSTSISLPRAWKAPLALNAPILCWFSHLKKSFTFGFALYSETLRS